MTPTRVQVRDISARMAEGETGIRVLIDGTEWEVARAVSSTRHIRLTVRHENGIQELRLNGAAWIDLATEGASNGKV